MVKIPQSLHKESCVERAKIANTQTTHLFRSAYMIPLNEAMKPVAQYFALPKESPSDPINRIAYPDREAKGRAKIGRDARKDRVEQHETPGPG